MIPFYLHVGGKTEIAFWVSGKADPQFQGEYIAGLWMKDEKSRVERDMELEEDEGPRAWRHFCMSFNSNTHRLLGVNQSGVVINRTDTLLKDMTSNYNESVSNFCIMGITWQGNMKHMRRSLFGKLTDMNIFGYAMTSEKMLEWTQCRNPPQGDILSWEQAVWEEKDLVVEEEPLEDICSPKSQLVVLPALAQSEASTLCTAIGGTMRGIEEKHEEGTSSFWEHINSQCPLWRSWTGYEYKGVAGQYWDPETKTFQVQEASSGGSRGRCVVLSLMTGDEEPSLNTNSLQPWGCKSQLCTLCKTSPKQFYLRGSLEPDIDQIYAMEHSQGGGKFNFVGATRNSMEYNNETLRWELMNLKKGIVMASRNDSHGKPPIGIYPWLDTRSGLLLNLSFTTCGPEEFSCSNGDCIPLSFRCDNKLNCPDGVDESLCELVDLRSSSYMKDIPPLSNVSLSMHIIQIVDTRERENTITVRFALALSWVDARLDFLNLRDKPITNIVSPKEMSQIWRPKVDIQNMLENIKTDEALVTVVKQGKMMDTRARGIVRDHIYDGSEHTLKEEYSQTLKLTCSFNLGDYPFDSQSCKIGVALQGIASISMKLKAEEVTISRDRNGDLLQYEVGEVTMKEFKHPNHEGVQISINLKRRIDGLLITTYLPTVMMNIINQATMYIDRDKFFETIMTTNITCMTVLASLYILFSSVVPQTSYIKSVDIWFLFNLIYPFCLILLHILIQKLKLDDEPGTRVFTSSRVALKGAPH